MGIDAGDPIVLGFRHRLLGLNEVGRIRHTKLEAILGLAQTFRSQRLIFDRYFYALGSSCQIQKGRTYVEYGSSLRIGKLGSSLIGGCLSVENVRFDSPSSENWN
jgi:hypothetical protein